MDRTTTQYIYTTQMVSGPRPYWLCWDWWIIRAGGAYHIGAYLMLSIVAIIVVAVTRRYTGDIPALRRHTMPAIRERCRRLMDSHRPLPCGRG